MDTLFWIIASTFFVSLVGLAGAVTLFLRKEKLNEIIYLLTAFAVGGLLGGAFFHLLPESMQTLTPDIALLYALIGFMAFLVMEIYFHWHLCGNCEVHPYSYLLLFGDSIHNFIDGLVIAGSFLVSVPFGLVTTIIIIAHEIPEEMGIFGVLVKGGLSRKNAIIYSFLVQCTALIGGIAGFYMSNSINGFSSFLLPFAGGGFLYIAGSGLIPELHKEENFKKLISLALIIVGLLFMWAIRALAPGA
jgi:zinc and cadmium transporter